jgi:transcriptional regulator GlxA family with amidase domain
MNRREWLKKSSAFGLMTTVSAAFLKGSPSEAASAGWSRQLGERATAAGRLTPPVNGPIPVAFLISDNAVVIDFAGPWEVFGNVMVGGRMDIFNCYTVSETRAPIKASGGMIVTPDYTLETAPAPRVLVIPAQSNSSEAVLEWIRRSSKAADVVMSVCTGAYLLAQTGLLDGKRATTHHGSYVDLSMKFPHVKVERGVRFVEDGNLASSGGLSCGIDLAMRVVERYFGREQAVQTAFDMEYQGEGWMRPNSNALYTKTRTSTDNHPLCAVCSMDVSLATAPTSVYKGQHYLFCSQDHKRQFDAAPERFVS